MVAAAGASVHRPVAAKRCWRHRVKPSDGFAVRLSRICVEARMMNMSVIVNGLVGASKEEWYTLKGEELIDYMIQKREKIVETIIGLFDE